VTYINGIRTPEAECKDHARMLADLFGVPCYALWNKTAVPRERESVCGGGMVGGVEQESSKEWCVWRDQPGN